MKLLLTSSGFTNTSIINALKDLSDEPLKNLKLSYIPTAANVEKGDKGWLIDDLERCKNIGFASIDIVDFTSVPKDVWQPRLEDTDVILFGGGNTYHLLYSLQQTGLDTMLPSLLEKRIFVGISAGSIVASKHVNLSDSPKLYSENIGKIEITEGLGFINFQIRPHFNSKWFPNVNRKTLEEITQNIEDTVYAIDDKTAIKVNGEEVTIVSEGEWARYN